MADSEMKFQYQLLDAWGNRLYTIQIKLRGEKRVSYWKIGEKRKQLPLSPEASEQVSQLLQEPAFYGFDRLEQEAQVMGLLDGTISSLTYTDGAHTQGLYVCNLTNYQIDPERGPHAAAVRTLLQALKTILEKAGVPETFFAEGWV